MGRSIHFYAVPDEIKHDKSKAICMNLDYERTLDESIDCLHSHLKGDTRYESFREESIEAEKIWEENQPYSWEGCEQKTSDAWCPWCAVFSNNGFYKSPVVKDSINFGHSYSSPIWESDWHFCNMYPGEDHSDLVNRFNKERMYRQIHDADVQKMERIIESLGNVYCTADKEALNETLEAIRFCNKWLDEPGIAVIYESEL